MLKRTLLITLAGVSAFTAQKNQCVDYYSQPSTSKMLPSVEDIVAKERKLLKRQERVKIANPRVVDQLYYAMLIKQFESEFSIILNENYKEILKRIIFDPDSLSTVDWNMQRSGSPHETKVSEENPSASLLKSYLNLNHLTIDKQENDAEAILSEIRGKDVQLTQLEKVALRASRIIGRDYDFFVGTAYEIPEVQIKRMKARFLSLFSFAGKTLSDKELDALYKSFVITDNPMSTFRYSLSQVYNFTYKNTHGLDTPYITKEMIAARNQRMLDIAEKYKNPVLTAEINKKLEDPKAKAALNELNDKIEKEPGLAESIRFVRLEIYKMTGKQKPFETAAEFGVWVEKQTAFFKDGLATLKEPGIKEKLKAVLKGLTDQSTYDGHMKLLKSSLDVSKRENKEIIEFMESPLGMRLFGAVRDEYIRMKPRFWQRTPKIGFDEIESLFLRNIDYLEETTMLKRKRPDLFQTVFDFKLVRTGLTKAEVTEIFRIAQRNSAMRLMKLLIFDPLARYGFCFGRAFFYHRMMLRHGVHPDSLGKVIVDGKMSGGLTGWAWHIAATAEREGGGLWVLDQSHGEPQSITEWFNHYRDHLKPEGGVEQGASKDDRIKIFFTPGYRFGRDFWGDQDFNVMSTEYQSIWNKLGADVRYFRDVSKNLEENNYNEEVKDAFEKLEDSLFDALKIGL